MPTDIIESTVVEKGDAPSGQERDAANASTASGRCDSHTLPEEVQAQNAEAQGHADDRQAS